MKVEHARKLLRAPVVQRFLRDYFDPELLWGVDVTIEADDNELRIALKKGDHACSLTYRMEWLAERGDTAAALFIVVHEVEHALAGLTP